MSIGSVDGQTRGSLTFRHLDVAQAGRYTVELTYVRNTLGGMTISVQVDNAPAFQQVLKQTQDSVIIPLALHAGVNSVSFGYSGKGAFNIDKIRLLR